MCWIFNLPLYPPFFLVEDNILESFSSDIIILLSIIYIQVNKYLENYERALSGFEAAASKDPGLNATEEADKLISLLDKLDSFLRVSCKYTCQPFEGLFIYNVLCGLYEIDVFVYW